MSMTVWESMELSLQWIRSRTEACGSRLKGVWMGTRDVIVWILLQSYNQEDGVDKALYRQIEVSHSQTPGPHGGLQLPQYLLEEQHRRAQAI